MEPKAYFLRVGRNNHKSLEVELEDGASHKDLGRKGTVTQVMTGIIYIRGV